MKRGWREFIHLVQNGTRAQQNALISQMPLRLAASARNTTHLTSRHVRELRLNKLFLDSLGSNTRVLEVGPGTGRLADWLLRHSELDERNYEMLDLAYGINPPYLKKRVFLLKQRRPNQARRGNVFTEILPKEKYDHILLPRSFTPQTHPKYSEILGENQSEPEAYSRVMKELLLKLAPSLKIQGSIRISYVDDSTAEEMARDPAFKDFSKIISGAPSGTDLILEKNKHKN